MPDAQKGRVIVLRGISGAGKSTYAKRQFPDAVIVSADDYFRQDDGTYAYVPSLVDRAHEACYQAFLEAMMQNVPLIVVDNTNVFLWELSPYVMPAMSFGYDVEILTLDCDPEVAIQRKDWVPPAKVRKKAVLLKQEQAKMPPFMRDRHRVIQTDIEL